MESEPIMQRSRSVAWIYKDHRAIRFDSACSVKNSPHGHKQKPLIENMGEGMTRCAVERQLSADTHTDHHVSELIIETVRKYFPEVVLDHSKNNRKEGHHQANRDQEGCTSESARQRRIANLA